MIRTLIVFSLLIGSVCRGQTDFKGNTLGESLKDFRDRNDRPAGVGGDRAPHFSFSPGDRLKGQIVARTQIPWEEREKGKETFASVPSTIRYFFVCDSTADWDLLQPDYGPTAPRGYPWSQRQSEAAERARLWMATAAFSVHDFDTVIRALISRFGEPNTRKTNVVTSGIGGVYESRQLQWMVGDVMIDATERSGRIDESTVVYLSTTANALADRFLKAAETEASKDI